MCVYARLCLEARQHVSHTALLALSACALSLHNAALPPHAQVEEGLNPLDADTFQQFPLVSTFAFNYPPELVGLMAAHAAHMLTSNKALVEGMMPAPPPRQM